MCFKEKYEVVEEYVTGGSTLIWDIKGFLEEAKCKLRPEA